jgi:hypothetical protein
MQSVMFIEINYLDSISMVMFRWAMYQQHLKQRTLAAHSIFPMSMPFTVLHEPHHCGRGGI